MDQRTKWRQILEGLQDTTLEETNEVLFKTYQGALKDIKKQAKRYIDEYDTLSFSKRLEAERLLDVGEKIKVILDKATGNVTDAIIDGTAQQAKLGYYGTFYALEGAENINIPVSILNEKYIETIVNQPVNGKTLSKRLYQNRDQLAKITTRSIIQGAIEGKGYAYVAKRIEDQTESTYKRALRIARTEGGRVSSLATQKAYEDAHDVGVGLQKRWLSTLDKKTRHSHQELDGQTVDVDEYFTSPITGATGQGPRLLGRASEDINCRCTTIAIVDGIEPQLRRDNESKEMIQNMTYNEWLQSKGIITPSSSLAPLSVAATPARAQYKSTSEVYNSVKYTGIEKSYAQSIDDRLLDLQNTYPISPGKIDITARPNKRAFGYNSSNIVGRKINGQQYAVFEQNINFSNTYMNNLQNSLTEHRFNYKARGSMLVDDMTGLTTVDHEYAHAIDMAYRLKSREDLAKIADKYATPRPITIIEAKEINQFNKELHNAKESMSEVVYDRLKTKMGLSNVDFIATVRKELGSYAIESRAEFLAEGFANARNLSNPSKFIKDFKEIFDEEYNTVIGGASKNASS